MDLTGVNVFLLGIIESGAANFFKFKLIFK